MKAHRLLPSQNAPAPSTRTERKIAAFGSAVLRWIIAFASLAVALAVRWVLDPWLGDTFQVLTLFGGTAFAVWMAGWKPAAVASAVALVASTILFHAPRLEFIRPVGFITAELIAYALSSAVILFVGEKMRRSTLREQENARALREQIAERERIERALRVSDEQLHLALESGRIGMWRTDYVTSRTESTAFNKTLFGYSPEDTVVNEEDWLAHIHPDDRAPLLANWAAAAAALAPYSMDFRVIWPDGSEHWLMSRGKFEVGPDGKASAISGITIEVTERKQAEAALRSHAQQLAVMAHVAPVYIVQYDLQRRIKFVNASYAARFGLTPEDCVGRHFAEVVGVEAYERCRKEMDRALSGEPVTFEVEIPYPVIGLRYMYCAYAPEFGADGKVAGMVAAVTDVTDRRRMEADVRAAKEQAEAANRAKDEFLAALSHELRTPLTPVLMTAAALETDSAVPAHLREQLTMMRRNIELEARLIDDLLDITRIVRGKLTLDRSPTDVHDLLDHTAQIVRTDVQARQVELRLRLHAAQHHVSGDPTRLQQVFWNIVKNAAKFTPSGGSVTITTHNTPDERLVVMISDTGVGIAAGMLQRIFEPFQQAYSPSHRFGGLGLGLAISKAIVELHHGTIEADSRGLGSGATFTVTLPSIPVPSSKESPMLDRAVAQSSPLRVLVVEDHEATLQVLTRLLLRSGHEVTAVASAGAALDAVDKHRFDVVVSDLGLPDLSGHDLFREVQRRQHCAGIALSGFGMEDDLRRSREAGFAAHLTKPIDFQQLSQELERIAQVQRQPASIG